MTYLNITTRHLGKSLQKNATVFLILQDLVFTKELWKKLLTIEPIVRVDLFATAGECLHNMPLRPAVIVIDEDSIHANGEIITTMKEADPLTEIIILTSNKEFRTEFTWKTKGVFACIKKGNKACTKTLQVIWTILKGEKRIARCN